MSVYEHQINDLNAQINELKKKKRIAEEKEIALRMKGLDNLIPPNIKNLTDHLHSVLCNYNHTDDCSWYYEFLTVDGVKVVDWNGCAHNRYLQLAEKLVKQHGDKTDINTIIEIVSSLK